MSFDHAVPVPPAPRRALRPAEVEAMAAVLGHVEGLPRDVARQQIESVLARGDRRLEVPHVRT